MREALDKQTIEAVQEATEIDDDALKSDDDDSLEITKMKAEKKKQLAIINKNICIYIYRYSCRDLSLVDENSNRARQNNIVEQAKGDKSGDKLEPADRRRFDKALTSAPQEILKEFNELKNLKYGCNKQDCTI